MTTFTKGANFVFRGAILAAAGAVAAVFVNGGKVLETVMNTAENAAASVSGLDLAGVLGNVKLVTIALLIASILSCVAFKCTKTGFSIVRSIVLFGLTGLSVVGGTMFHFADMVVRHGTGAVTAAELEIARPILDAFSKEGYGDGMAVSSLSACGLTVNMLIGAVLAILVVTSIVSIVKTVRSKNC